MTFGAPDASIVLVLLPLLLALLWYASSRDRFNLESFVGDSFYRPRAVDHEPRRKWLKSRLSLAAIGVLGLAIMQPQWGTDPRDVRREGRDLLILLDISLSMLAEDVSPNRMDRAKELIEGFVGQLKSSGGDRLGLIGFAGRAHLQCPITLDYDYFLERLDALDTTAAVREGSLLGDAVRQALEGFGEIDLDHTDIILFSDGDDHGSLPVDTARWAGMQNVSLHTVLIGDPNGDGRIPMTDENGVRSFLDHGSGVIRATAQPGVMVEMARLSDGIPLTESAEVSDLRDLYSQHIAAKPGREIASAAGEGAAHRFQWFVGLALLLLVCEMLIGERPAGRARA